MQDERVSQLLSAYIDGELPVDEVRQIETELAGSPTLRRELAELRQLSELLGQARRQRLAPMQLARLHEGVNRHRHRMMFRTAQYAATVAGAVLLFCGITVWKVPRDKQIVEAQMLDSIVLAMGDSEFTEEENGDARLAAWVVTALSRSHANE